MTMTDLEEWLRGYGRAWETRDPEAAAVLFAEDVRYHETPFRDPAVGRDGIRAYWTAATANQRDVHFHHEVLCLENEMGIARWRANFLTLPKGKETRLDGIFLLRFNEDGHCQELREWWHAGPRR